MRYTLLILALALTPFACGQTITPVHGASWLTHIHRPFDQTSMGKSSGVYGPKAPMPGDWPPSTAPNAAIHLTPQKKSLSGADLYRFKCRGCHGLFGIGALPEIRSVIDPVRATGRHPSSQTSSTSVVGTPAQGRNRHAPARSSSHRQRSPFAFSIPPTTGWNTRRRKAAGRDYRAPAADRRAHCEIHMPYLSWCGWPQPDSRRNPAGADSSPQ